MFESNAYRKLFGALLALPNLAAAFSSTSLLFLPGAQWNQDQRLVSSIGQDATATTWAITCTPNPTATRTCDIPSPYLLYTIGPSTMHAVNTISAPNFDITCALAPSISALCSGHVTNIPWTTTMNAAFLSSYGYRAVTVTDAFHTSISSTTAPTTTSPPKTASGSASVTGPGINSAILNSYGGTSTAGTAKSSAGGGLGGVASKSKSAEAPRVTGAMGLMAVVAIVGGAVGWEV
ncbi:hypothetical protein N431DRAFT_547888 [Stipitochalara longipes BDJ]|nr:hypothetical protein N431DRAFT_547888 [Stipitochalara longipes BDJ]